MMAARREDRQGQDLSGELRGVLRLEEPMARHTVWGIGGPAREFYEPADESDLIAFVRARAGRRTNAESDGPDASDFFFLGLGSNLLVRDGGLRGGARCAGPAQGAQAQGRGRGPQGA